jgi:hypothetical protein
MRGPPGDPLATRRCSVRRRGSDDPDDRGAVREWLAFPGDRRPDKLPGEVRPGRRTMTGELAACGWRLGREFRIVPPDDNPRPAVEVEGRNRAIREAAREARIG